jgi:hypothetical protein
VTFAGVQFELPAYPNYAASELHPNGSHSVPSKKWNGMNSVLHEITCLWRKCAALAPAYVISVVVIHEPVERCSERQRPWAVWVDRGLINHHNDNTTC